MELLQIQRKELSNSVQSLMLSLQFTEHLLGYAGGTCGTQRQLDEAKKPPVLPLCSEGFPGSRQGEVPGTKWGRIRWLQYSGLPALWLKAGQPGCSGTALSSAEASQGELRNAGPANSAFHIQLFTWLAGTDWLYSPQSKQSLLGKMNGERDTGKKGNNKTPP